MAADFAEKVDGVEYYDVGAGQLLEEEKEEQYQERLHHVRLFVQVELFLHFEQPGFFVVFRIFLVGKFRRSRLDQGLVLDFEDLNGIWSDLNVFAVPDHTFLSE